MTDQRVLNHAKILVRYSTRVGEGDTCLIEGPTAAEPLIAAVYDEVLRAGGQPVLAMAFDSFWRGGGRLTLGFLAGGLCSAFGVAVASWRR